MRSGTERNRGAGEREAEVAQLTELAALMKQKVRSDRARAAAKNRHISSMDATGIDVACAARITL